MTTCIIFGSSKNQGNTYQLAHAVDKDMLYVICQDRFELPANSAGIQTFSIGLYAD